MFRLLSVPAETRVLPSPGEKRASQVPAFNSVYVRKNFPKIMTEEMGLDVKIMDSDDQLRFYNALYYMFKEIYYNAFLLDSGVLDRFVNMATKTAKNYNENHSRELRNKAKDLKRQKRSEDAKKLEEEAKKYEAENDFGQRILAIRDSSEKYSLAQVCQLIMTEYNQQNTGNMRRKSTDKSNKNPDSYQHYKMLLMINLRKAFGEYVKEKYRFALSPVKRELGDKEAFMPDFAQIVKPYADLTKKIKESAELQKWYVVGRLLSPKQANMMLGSIRSYKQYVWDIYRRADETGTKVNKRVSMDKISGVAIRKTENQIF